MNCRITVGPVTSRLMSM